MNSVIKKETLRLLRILRYSLQRWNKSVPIIKKLGYYNYNIFISKSLSKVIMNRSNLRANIAKTELMKIGQIIRHRRAIVLII